MEMGSARRALAAPADDRRPAIVRLPVRERPDGLPEGSVAAALELPLSSLCFHLEGLDRSGLARATRKRQQTFHAVDHAQVRRLPACLIAGCCDGHREICQDLGALLARCDQPRGWVPCPSEH